MENSKQAYDCPRLTVFGAVRNLTGGSAGNASDGANATPNNPNKTPNSDRRLKENIVQVGTHEAGFNLYLFDYKAEFADLGEGRQFGVMADEVETIVPAAVERNAEGYAWVNYDMLGITRH